MSQSMISEPCPAAGHGVAELRSPRRSPYVSPPQSAAGPIVGRTPPSHERAPDGNASVPSPPKGSPGRSLTDRWSNHAANPIPRPRTNRGPPPLTRRGPAAMSNSLSMPAIARQHVHTTPIAGKRSSATLLASAAEADRSHVHTSPKRQSPTLDVDRREQESRRSLSDRISSSSSNGDGSSPETMSTSLDSAQNRRENAISSVTTVGSEDKLAVGSDRHLSPSSTDTLQRQGSAFAWTEPIACQPLTPPTPSSKGSRADDSVAQKVTEEDEVRPNDNHSAAHADGTGKVCFAPTELEEQQLQQPPTIEQRDALATRVYLACQASGYEEWVWLLELAPLASQHHLSGYNCIKFGQQGSPYAYLPLSLQQPAQAQELMEKQKRSEASALTWLAQKRFKQQRNPLQNADRAKVPRLSRKQSGEGHQSRLIASKDSKSDSEHLDAGPDVRMRERSPVDCRNGKCEGCSGDAGFPDGQSVCECGPLKDEAVLNAEWEAPISTDTDGKGELAPCVDGSNGNGTNGSITTECQGMAVKTSDTHPISISPIIPPELLGDISSRVRAGFPPSIHDQIWSRKQFDSDTTDHAHHTLQVNGERLIRCRMTEIDLCEVAFRAERELIDAFYEQRKPRALRLRQPDISEPPPQVLRDAVTSDTDLASFMAGRSIYCETLCCDSEPDDVLHLDPSLPSDVKAAYQPERNGVQGDTREAFVMGNLLLSSCPGKKVRLTGPVRGRGAICRDLGVDLMRIRQLGVGAIVCCLDDEELSFLGAPWSQYEQEADKLGIEVIRLPMAEGFCPTDVVATDKAVGCVVNDYTLRGIHVLVHCRGGVGRAGLIACMWMLKLGLVRSDRDEICFRVPLNSLASLRSCSPTLDQRKAKDKANDDVMQTIHRLIETIRRRRSPKAIETAEQVSFLVKVSYSIS